MTFTAGLTSRTNTFGLRGRALRAAITITAVSGFGLFGYDQGLMSGIITSRQFNLEFPPTEDNTVNQGAVVASYEIGCFFGALFVLFRGDLIGRRPIVLIGGLVMVIGAIISTASFGPQWGLGQFIVGRVISGLGNGMNTATIPVWQSELSKASNRGLLVNIEGSFVAVGTFVAYWVNFGLSYVENNSVSWRFPVALQIPLAMIVMVGIWGLPESPRWLIAKGRVEEARSILAALQPRHQEDKEEVDSEIRVVRDAITRTGKQLGLRDLFTNGKSQHFRRMLLGASTQFFQQFTGCNAAIYYSTVLFEESLGQSRRMALVLGGVFSTVYMFSTIPSFFLIERIGRRTLFLIGAIGQGISFIITFACLAAPETVNSAKGAAVGLYLFIFTFAWTILPLPWVYPPEINPLKTRTVATSVSTCTNWICNFAVVMFTPIFIGNTRWGAYLFFALFNFSWVPIIFFYYPETAGRSLEEMDIIFAKAHVEKTPAYRVANTLPKLSNDQVEAEAEKLGLFELSHDPEAAKANDQPAASPTETESLERS